MFFYEGHKSRKKFRLFFGKPQFVSFLMPLIDQLLRNSISIWHILKKKKTHPIDNIMGLSMRNGTIKMYVCGVGVFYDVWLRVEKREMVANVQVAKSFDQQTLTSWMHSGNVCCCFLCKRVCTIYMYSICSEIEGHRIWVGHFYVFVFL